MRAHCACVLIALPLAALPGCQTAAPPRLAIADVQVTEVTDQGSAMVVTVRAENPNDKPLPLRSIDYRVSLGGEEVFKATRIAEAVLPRFGVIDLPLPVSVPVTERPAGETDFHLWLTLHYLAPGKIAETLYDAGLRRPSVSGDGGASVDLGG
jgi:hypothetical protein